MAMPAIIAKPLATLSMLSAKIAVTSSCVE